jgi:hypothetical protein
MLFADGFGLLIVLALWLFCLIDVITTPDDQVRNLPKLVWLLIVIVLFDLGCIAWLVAGRPWNRTAPNSPTAAKYPEYDRPGRHVPNNPDDDEAFLAGLKARADEQRRRAREASEPKDETDPS